MPAQFLVLPQPISGHGHPILRDLSFETERIHMVGNQEVGSQTLLLDLLGEHGLDLLGARHEVPDLDAVDEGD